MSAPFVKVDRRWWYAPVLVAARLLARAARSLTNFALDRGLVVRRKATA